MERYSSDNSGCGCIIIIVIAIVFGINKCTESKTKSSVSPSAHQHIKPLSDEMSIEKQLSDEDKLYLTNSLPTGATPYKSIYGQNYVCPYHQCSGIKVTAPKESDIVVIIKQNNSDGEVIAHSYIKAGDTYLFSIPDGVYQTFFYYGEGWSPTKEVKDGLRGGFVRNVLFSKDEPQEIYSAVLNYVLQLQYDGNFQTKDSNPSEVF